MGHCEFGSGDAAAWSAAGAGSEKDAEDESCPENDDGHWRLHEVGDAVEGEVEGGGAGLHVLVGDAHELDEYDADSADDGEGEASGEGSDGERDELVDKTSPAGNWGWRDCSLGHCMPPFRAMIDEWPDYRNLSVLSLDLLRQ